MATTQDTIDKLVINLLRSDEGNAILTNFAALQRKLKAAGIDPHSLLLRNKSEVGKVTNSIVQATVMYHEECDRHKETKRKLDQEIEKNFKLEGQVTQWRKAANEANEIDPDVVEVAQRMVEVDRKKRAAELIGKDQEIKTLGDKLRAIQELIG